jgi:5-hydroxyisourate hydrolase-like protein (transthyretin family)
MTCGSDVPGVAMRWRRARLASRLAAAAAVALLTLAGAAAAAAQEVRGRVLDDETGQPIGGVVVTLIDAEERNAATVVTDSTGAFLLAARSAGTYTLSFAHLAYAPYRSEPLPLTTAERVSMEVRLGRTVHAMAPLTVTARAGRHDATYDGLYARLPRFPAQVGSNRILVKGDMELSHAWTARDVIERWFPTVARRLGTACVHWNGFLLSPAGAEGALLRHVEDLEAIEVYGDYLMAPMTMWGPPITPLTTQCSSVIALWALRPDLPGRSGR